MSHFTLGTILTLMSLFGLFTQGVDAKLCNPAKERCWLSKGSSSSSPAYPSRSSSININPSAVPVEDGFGIETITYDGEWDFALIKGTGRVGAAVSPTNGEDGFFGPPGLELAAEYLERKNKKEKYKSQKFNFATAVNVFSNKKKGLRQFHLNIGVLAKYNTVSRSAFLGGGAGVVLGPLNFGYSKSEDQYVLEKEQYSLSEDLKINYDVETFSAGIYLNSLALDFSELVMNYEDGEVSRVSLMTASLLLRRAIFTASRRREDSFRPKYNFNTRQLESERQKYEYFGGVQVGVTETIMIGAFYNYYLLREISFGLTWFI